MLVGLYDERDDVHQQIAGRRRAVMAARGEKIRGRYGLFRGDRHFSDHLIYCPPQ